MSYHCDGTYDVYHEVRVFARKQHECDSVLCSEPIRKGDAYWRVSVVHEGRAEMYKRCIRCQAIHLHLRELGEGERWPDERLACGQDYEEEWGRKPPADIAALAFWRAGEALPARQPCTRLNRWHAAAEGCCYQYTYRRTYWRCNSSFWPTSAIYVHACSAAGALTNSSGAGASRSGV